MPTSWNFTPGKVLGCLSSMDSAWLILQCDNDTNSLMALWRRMVPCDLLTPHTPTCHLCDNHGDASTIRPFIAKKNLGKIFNGIVSILPRWLGNSVVFTNLWGFYSFLTKKTKIGMLITSEKRSTWKLSSVIDNLVARYHQCLVYHAIFQSL